MVKAMRKRLTRMTLCGFLAAPPLVAQERPFIDEPRPMSQRAPEEIEEWAWQEGEAKLPAFPQEADLVEFRVDDPTGRFRYFLDRRSLAVDKVGGVVQYTVAIESQTGARNLAHEGIRCQTLEYKIYAYGGTDGRFRPVREPQWKEIRGDRLNRFRRDLHDFFLCDNLLPRGMGDIQRALEKGGEAKGSPFIGG
jgi:hypothetical protein